MKNESFMKWFLTNYWKVILMWIIAIPAVIGYCIYFILVMSWVVETDFDRVLGLIIGFIPLITAFTIMAIWWVYGDYKSYMKRQICNDVKT